jgi:hypothetical protein
MFQRGVWAIVWVLVSVVTGLWRAEDSKTVWKTVCIYMAAASPVCCSLIEHMTSLRMCACTRLHANVLQVYVRLAFAVSADVAGMNLEATDRHIGRGERQEPLNAPHVHFAVSP